MKVKSEVGYLQKWIHKGRKLGKEPPAVSAAQYNLDLEDPSSAMEQINLKVPRGTKERLKRLGLQEGGLSMRRMFKRMLDEFEAKHRQNGKK